MEEVSTIACRVAVQGTDNRDWQDIPRDWELGTLYQAHLHLLQQTTSIKV